MPDAASQLVTCRCGEVALQVTGPPINVTECHCDSCREAGRILGLLPDAPPLLEENGGTRSVMQRKDRVDCVRGSERLRELRLKADSKTRRVVAECCSAAMFLDFERGHWLDVYTRRWPDGTGLAPEMRTMTGDRPPDAQPLADDIPNLKTHSLRFYARLMRAWAAMGFRTPPIPWGRGKPVRQGEIVHA